MAEFVGGTTAGVAAVCCCVPCAVVDFTVFTMYKVPKGLCKNAMRRRQRRLMMQRYEDDELTMHPAVVTAAERFVILEIDEDEIWDKFNETGFWRSCEELND